jgi:hypothetical protein
MKNKWIVLCFYCLISLSINAKPSNLYEQLCEVNQEWLKNRSIAQELGFLEAPIMQNEQDLLVFHIQTLQAIFSKRPSVHLNLNQQQVRLRHLQVLAQYAQLRDCPRNYYIPYRIPVFIDDAGRYCAVAYLMLHSGKKAFCEAVQKNSNYIYIHQIENQEFAEWQRNSGLSLDELAWIQPAYMPVVKLIRWNPQTLHQKPIFLDSLATARIYLPEYDFKDIFGLTRIFWGVIVSDSTLRHIAKPLTQQPDWSTMPSGIVKCATIYRQELYIGIQLIKKVKIDENESEDIYYSGVLKWSKAQKWELVLDLNHSTSSHTIYSLFEYGGKLYAGGGDASYHSYLAVLQNGQWKEIKQDFGGCIFGLIYKNKQVYLGAARPPDDFMPQPNPEEERENNASGDGK